MSKREFLAAVSLSTVRFAAASGDKNALRDVFRAMTYWLISERPRGEARGDAVIGASASSPAWSSPLPEPAKSMSSSTVIFRDMQCKKVDRTKGVRHGYENNALTIVLVVIVVDAEASGSGLRTASGAGAASIATCIE
jgi:cellulase/cellobiase CelA1